VRGSGLWHERALVHSRRGDHAAALADLALRAGCVDGAIAYCRALRGGQEAWLALLELFLRPAAAAAAAGEDDDCDGGGSGSGGPPAPNYAAAVRVLNAHGARLNPQRLLSALDDGMPLGLASEALARALAGATHRRRTGQVVRALSRARHLAAQAERAELLGGRVVVGDDTGCRGCGRLLGGRVFFRYPSGVVLCGRCVGPGAGAGAGAAGSGSGAGAPTGEPGGGGGGGSGAEQLQLPWG
jgi:hypothetical protein